ncbi:siphovirus ReqiPepy6 Gp37-like family protein [Cytobacillus sp. Hm23]
MIFIKPIRILTSDMQLLAEIDDFESLIFTRRFHNIGEFELHINRHKQHTDKLIKGNLILLGSDLHKVGIIKHREIGIDDNGKQSEIWVIKGVELKGIVVQRITHPPNNTSYDHKSGNAETIMKHYVERNIVNPDDSNRAISILELVGNLNRGQSITWQSRFKNLSEELAAISMSTNLGWDIRLDLQNNKWLFDVFEGRNLTVNQNENPPVIFSLEFDSLKSLKFTDSDVGYKNYAYVGGDGEGISRKIVGVGNTSDLLRFEAFFDARNIREKDDDDLPIPEDEILKALEESGKQKLLELAQEQFLEGQILTHSPFQYEKDYDLGDIVTIQNKDWGVTMDARITELTEIYEPSGFQLEATFGNKIPTLISKVKQELHQLDAEIMK